VATQLMAAGPIRSSRPMDGTATATDAAMKGVRNVERVVTKRAASFFLRSRDDSPVRMTLFMNTPFSCPLGTEIARAVLRPDRTCTIAQFAVSMKGESTKNRAADHRDEPSLAGFLTGRGSLPYNRTVGAMTPPTPMASLKNSACYATW
jgi:hypothetical protein